MKISEIYVEECKHERAGPQNFDSEEALGMSAYEVRLRWPRGNKCPDCGATGAFYASYEHYLAGDW